MSYGSTITKILSSFRTFDQLQALSRFGSRDSHEMVFFICFYPEPTENYTSIVVCANNANKEGSNNSQVYLTISGEFWPTL